MTQTTIAPSDEGVADFTEHIDVQFTIDDDTFIGKTNIPGKHLIKFGALFEGLSTEQIMTNADAFDQLFRMVLTKDSAQRFIDRMDSEDEPIAMTQVMRILPWLMEKYGMRPTEPSSNSSIGQPNLGDGTSSTVNASDTALNLVNSRPTGS